MVDAVSTGKTWIGRRRMTRAEQMVSEAIYTAIHEYDEQRDRSKQAAQFKLGLSDLGYCSERARRMLDQQVPERTDMLAAFIGTAIGDHAEEAIKWRFPGAIVQSEVTLELKGEKYTYTLPGHPDVIFPASKTLLDGKTDYGLADVERNGPTRAQQFQRHGYGLAAWQAGVFGDCDISEVHVGNYWIDRAAVDKRIYVQMEPLNPEVIREMTDWLDEVVYNYENDQEAAKEPPRQVCEATCGFFDRCRALDTDVEGLIRDPRTVDAVHAYREGLDMEKQGKRLKEVSREHLRGVKGSTGEYLVRWVWINGSGERDGYEKLDIRQIPVKRPGPRKEQP